MNSKIQNLLGGILCILLFCSEFARPLLAQTQDRTFYLSENFRNGIGNWYADNGLWEVGTPTAGPSDTPSSSLVAGTVLNGNYPSTARSRLVSPPIHLPVDPELTQNKLRLQFLHWHSFNSGDSGWVQISIDRSNWTNLQESNPIVGISHNWTTVIIPDLSEYAGQTVFIGFAFKAQDSEVSTGWYIDDFTVYSEPIDLFTGNEDFFPPVLDWTIENGVWEFGALTENIGPGLTSLNVAATVLGGSYPDVGEARLISPYLEILDDSTLGMFTVQIRHWFEFAGGDEGILQISINDAAWVNISNPFKGISGGWTSYIAPDLSEMISEGDRVRFALLLSTENPSGNHAGWYVDEITARRFTPTDIPSYSEGANLIELENPKDDLEPLKQWFSENGVWQIGEIDSGYVDSKIDRVVASTVLEGNYPNGTFSRLVSPPFSIGDSITFLVRFQHWFDFSPGDRGIVQVSVDNGKWVDLSSGYFENRGAVWSKAHTLYANNVLDPSTLTEDSIYRIGFLFESQSSGTTRAGWYVDDIIIEGRNTTSSANESPKFSQPATLHQNYPNPFNSSTTITFSLEAPEQISLKVYDLLGREIETLVDELLPMGVHSIEWETGIHASGIYLYRLQTSSSVLTRKMHLVK